jgi:Protein of unknown function (DUF3306)
MTASENFVSRWARLKSESDTGSKTELVEYEPQQEVVVSISTETLSLQQPNEAVEEPFDPASLPSIEMITADSDIRGFLQSRVPAALTRAALRQAWASDPAIRDFIGIAENQWDFNAPTTIPGFGPMQETDNVPALLARAMGGGDKLADLMPEIPAIVENALPAVTDRVPVHPERSLQKTSGRSQSAEPICNLAIDSNENTAIPSDRVAEEDNPSRSYRSHGGALPR